VAVHFLDLACGRQALLWRWATLGRYGDAPMLVSSGMIHGSRGTRCSWNAPLRRPQQPPCRRRRAGRGRLPPPGRARRGGRVIPFRLRNRRTAGEVDPFSARAGARRGRIPKLTIVRGQSRWPPTRLRMYLSTPDDKAAEVACPINELVHVFGPPISFPACSRPRSWPILLPAAQERDGFSAVIALPSGWDPVFGRDSSRTAIEHLPPPGRGRPCSWSGYQPKSRVGEALEGTSEDRLRGHRDAGPWAKECMLFSAQSSGV